MTGVGGAPGFAVDLRVPGRLEVSFSAGPGEVVAVIGPNGAGKSTLVRAVAGLVPGAGRVWLDGREVSGDLVRRRRVGLVFQDRVLFPHLTVRANVAFGPRSRGVRRREAERVAEAWLARLGIADLADRRPGQLSGGQAQRVAIARALATDPRLLLLDEPMAGLDVSVATDLRLELGGHLAAYDGTTLLVTHDAIDALTLADRVLVLDQGRVAQYGTPAEVSQHPRTEHVARLVGLNVLRGPAGLSAFAPTDVTVGLERPEGSARWQWRGTVSDVVPHGAALRVLVATEDGHRLIADVTPVAAAELGLSRGRGVWLSAKATAMRTYR